MRVHIMGVGGTGASAAARLARHRGHEVSGCDRSSGGAAQALRAEGMVVFDSHDAGHLTGCDRLAYSPALLYMEDVPEEFTRARERGIAVSWHDLMSEMTASLEGVAVAGTHGKSTVTAMVSMCLVASGLDPTCFVGAEVEAFHGNLRPGAGRHFVFEADEFNSSFLAYHPALAVLNLVEFDHPEYFRDAAAMEAEYRAFLEGMRSGRRVLYQASDEGASRVVAGTDSDATGFALAGETTHGSVSWLGTELRLTAGGTRLLVRRDGDPWVELQSPLAGRHNARNLVAACAAAAEVGASAEACATAMADFRGVGRRFELLAVADDVILIDDYAHHPSEVTATILAARQRFPGMRVIAVFQPHTHARTAALFDETVAALNEADRVLVTDVFVARDAPSVRADPAELASAITGGRGVHTGELVASAEEAMRLARRQPSVVLFMGAGDITRASQHARDLLQRASPS